MAELKPLSHYVLTTNGSVQRLSTVMDKADGVRIRWFTVQAGVGNAAAAYLGGSGVSSTDYGVRIPVPVTNIPAAPFLLEDPDEGLTLGDIYVIGASNEKLHFLIGAYV